MTKSVAPLGCDRSLCAASEWNFIFLIIVNWWVINLVFDFSDHGLEIEVLANKEDFRSVNDDLNSVKDILGNLVTSTDCLVGRTEMLNQ